MNFALWPGVYQKALTLVAEGSKSNYEASECLAYHQATRNIGVRVCGMLPFGVL